MQSSISSCKLEKGLAGVVAEVTRISVGLVPGGGGGCPAQFVNAVLQGKACPFAGGGGGNLETNGPFVCKESAPDHTHTKQQYKQETSLNRKAFCNLQKVAGSFAI